MAQVEITSSHRLLSVVSFNLHGLNQGKPAVIEIIDTCKPDIILLQEHWLTPANLFKLNEFDSYFAYGSSAMDHQVSLGPIFGRPFGGVAVLISNSLRSYCETLFSCERFLVLFDLIIINVYLPCDGTEDRLSICESILNDISYWRESYSTCDYILAGDLNVDFNNHNNVVKCVTEHCIQHNLANCYELFPDKKFTSYINESLGHASLLDYFLFTKPNDISDIFILDPDCNFSDHMPVMAEFWIRAKPFNRVLSDIYGTNKPASIECLRWDHADNVTYYEFCRSNLEPVLVEVNEAYFNRANISDDDAHFIIDDIHDRIVNVLSTAANLYVPHIRKKCT